MLVVVVLWNRLRICSIDTRRYNEEHTPRSHVITTRPTQMGFNSSKVV
ncbi:hypothetical protein MtrunA17_Chr7g0216251 [Medicago truncatula]|uniref:Uncharacterized protein n=1 Tax=Medicago truncatula TaxID=3880 RepID=A0A396GVC2_MEDTR|nr:hypothetical protein MtrunA17_Chr7g0216251 [Medicago truncatula]